MILTGISDEAGNTIEAQIEALTALGWKHIEMRGVQVSGHDKANFHDIPDAAFDLALEKLTDAGIRVYCFGSTIMNWAKRIHEPPFEVTLAEVRRCIPRMRKAGAGLVRIMSFKPGEDDNEIPAEVFRRMREVTRMFLDAGIQPVHENCMNYGGMSSRHARQLLGEVPGLKWVFDTANPIFNANRSRPKPWPKQDPWEFWTQVRDATAHIHVKDAIWNPSKNDADYRWPGEGDGRVLDILRDAFSRGYDSGISIEPHMVVVFHDAHSKSNDAAIQKNFIEYGNRLKSLVEAAKAAP
ncbi:MAG: sugar phosphate isomerase/epimerase [Verrucomicrobia bacterium]|nr:sugar phosphate isomerase/epimerase [Verrucomicrobiota bacterium]MBI3868606.1 sugar phosphate isomerase/epimerase [Verrucomicrobiota bacterium]